MDVAIVGGGITGLATAFEAISQGHRVAVYEKDAEIGGIIRDIVRSGRNYFNGCQYFTPGAPWFEHVAAAIDAEFAIFEHNYGSYTEILGNQQFHSDFAQPVIDRTAAVADLQEEQGSSVLSHLGRFPDDVAAALGTWARGFGAIDQIDQACASPMQIGRVFFNASVDAALSAKAASPLADALLGVPRSIRTPELKKAEAALPVHGYNAVVSALCSWLEQHGASLHTGRGVAPLRDKDGTVRLKWNGTFLTPDVTVWCANPTALLQVAGTGRLDSPASHMYCLVGDVDRLPGEAPVYYQVFSDHSSAVRLYFYACKGAKVSVEGFDRGQSSTEIIADVEELLHRMGMTLRISDPHVVRQKRHNLFTIRDLALMNAFEAQSANLGIIPGAWQHFTRDAKMSTILAAFSSWTTTP